MLMLVNEEKVCQGRNISTCFEKQLIYLRHFTIMYGLWFKNTKMGMTCDNDVD